jgi:hypothetical protein
MRVQILSLAVLFALGVCAGGDAVAGDRYAVADQLVPIFPPYPYRAGHYPRIESYYTLPPYTAVKPAFYRKRYFMMAQERNRYRYMPHIFSGYSDEDGSYLK